MFSFHSSVYNNNNNNNNNNHHYHNHNHNNNNRCRLQLYPQMSFPTSAHSLNTPGVTVRLSGEDGFARNGALVRTSAKMGPFARRRIRMLATDILANARSIGPVPTAPMVRLHREKEGEKGCISFISLLQNAIEKGESAFCVYSALYLVFFFSYGVSLFFLFSNF